MRETLEEREGYQTIRFVFCMVSNSQTANHREMCSLGMALWQTYWMVLCPDEACHWAPNEIIGRLLRNSKSQDLC